MKGDIGSDTGTAVSKAYRAPNLLTGTVDLIELRIVESRKGGS